MTKSKDIRSKYEIHVAKMLGLAGENATQAAADAKTVIAMETAMAKAQMDNVARRDPKNVNNKMSFEQMQALTPSFDWKKYTSDIGAPAVVPALSGEHSGVLQGAGGVDPAAFSGGLAGLSALATGARIGAVFEQGVCG